MTAKVTEQGVLVPKEMLVGVNEVEIEESQGVVVIRPAKSADPLWELGANPIQSDVTDASINHDHYLGGK